ncbi:MAG: hypothetical protein ABJN40_03565 [Sneathiella sp.]
MRQSLSKPALMILRTAPVALLMSASMAVAEDIKITITEKNCQRVEKHIARSDVAFKPGVDVYGRAVTPADLNDNKLVLPENIVIDLSLPLADLYAPGNTPPDALKNAEVKVGKLDYNILSDKLLFNGQELADPALHAIAQECRKKYNTKG